MLISFSCLKLKSKFKRKIKKVELRKYDRPTHKTIHLSIYSHTYFTHFNLACASSYQSHGILKM